MPDDADQPVTRLITDHERIRELVTDHDAVPAIIEYEDGHRAVIEGPTVDAASDRVSWDRFFKRFEEANCAVRYRPRQSGHGSRAELTVVQDAGPEARQATDVPPATDYDQIVTSDTGGEEPVELHPTESARDAEEVLADTAATSADKGKQGPADAANGLELVEIRERAHGDLDAEYVRFVNAGDRRLDLSGWRVRNEAGRTYRFPAGTTLDPDESVTVHSGRGKDTTQDLYWGATDSIWDARRDTVVVESETGERVLREPYES
jgi:hypothetical protein